MRVLDNNHLIARISQGEIHLGVDTASDLAKAVEIAKKPMNISENISFSTLCSLKIHEMAPFYCELNTEEELNEISEFF